MTQITITEALAELKTIDAKIAKKKEFIRMYLMRQDMIRDPLEKDGGSHEAISREMQSIGDLEERKISIRRAIAVSNSQVEITVLGKTRTIADWLVWRREIADSRASFFTHLSRTIDGQRQKMLSRNVTVSDNPQKPEDFVVNLNEKKLAEDIESLEETLGVLDGLLSLKNATVTIDVA